MAKIDLVSSDWVKLIFQNRNQEYGAYKLRVGTSKRNVKAIACMIILSVLAVIAMAIKKVVDDNAAKVAATSVTELSTLDQAKKKAEVKQKKIEVEPEKVVERVKSSIKFTAPVIKKDDQVKPEEELKTQDELNNTKTAIGTFNVKGSDDANGEVLKAKEAIAPPPPPTHEEENKVFEAVEQMPTFPGGASALQKYLHDNVRYPVVA